MEPIDKDHGVCTLVLNVKGELGIKNVPLILHYDTETPEFCPVRHLLLCVCLSGMTEGFLFPPEWEFGTGASHVHYQHSGFLAKLKFLCKEKLSRKSKNNIYGTHLLRHTGYLFAIQGALKVHTTPLRDCDDVLKFSVSAVMDAARHTSRKDLDLFTSDSMALYHWTKFAKEGTPELLEEVVLVWRDILIQEGKPSAASKGLQVTIYHVAQ